MPFSYHRPRVFEIGAVYHAAAQPHDLINEEKFYLVLGPSARCSRSKAYHLTDEPVEYEYLDLLTGEVNDFHRDSYFAERAELLCRA